MLCFQPYIFIFQFYLLKISFSHNTAKFLLSNIEVLKAPCRIIPFWLLTTYPETWRAFSGLKNFQELEGYKRDVLFAPKSENYSTASRGCQGRQITAFYKGISLKKHYHSCKELKHLIKNVLWYLICFMLFDIDLVHIFLSNCKFQFKMSIHALVIHIVVLYQALQNKTKTHQQRPDGACRVRAEA